jgi:hypothetical protein
MIDGLKNADTGLSRFCTSLKVRPTAGLRAARSTHCRYQLNSRRVGERSPRVPAGARSAETACTHASRWTRACSAKNKDRKLEFVVAFVVRIRRSAEADIAATVMP